MIGPLGRILYLLIVAVGVFFVPSPWVLLALVGAHGVAWRIAGLSWRQLARQLVKLGSFLIVILLAYALMPMEPAVDRWMPVDAWGLFTFDINTTGLAVGGAMVLRLVIIVLASQVARAGDPQAIVAGLRRIGVPVTAAISIDTVFALFGTKERRRGKGDGGGGGGGGWRRQREAAGERDDEMVEGEGFWRSVKKLARGDVGPIVQRLEKQIAQAESHLKTLEVPPAAKERLRDIAVIAGVSLTMLSVKVLKLLPGLPFAPGHKGIILLPLYVVAGLMTRGRWGATLTGVTMGTVAFLLGSSRYGIFEIFKHIAPGIVCDLMLPMLLRRASAPVTADQPLRRSVIARHVGLHMLTGVMMASARFATVFAVVLVTQTSAVAYAIFVPSLTSHLLFGFFSGYVSLSLVRVLSKPESAAATPAATSNKDIEHG